jgi:hypothetical protein
MGVVLFAEREAATLGHRQVRLNRRENARAVGQGENLTDVERLEVGHTQSGLPVELRQRLVRRRETWLEVAGDALPLTLIVGGGVTPPKETDPSTPLQRDRH